MYKYAKLKAAAATITAISLLILAIFSIQIWKEEKKQTCASQLATYTDVVETFTELRYPMDTRSVSLRLEANIDDCLVPHLKVPEPVEETNTLN